MESRELYGGKKWVLSLERKAGIESQVRRESGKKFQTVGAEKEKADLTRGIVKRFLSDDLRLRGGA